MERVLRGKVGPIASLFLIITFGILLGVTPVIAQETEEILPDQGFQFVTILQGQVASVAVTQTANYDVTVVFVTTLGNSTLGATLTPKTVPGGSGMGWWSLMAISPKGRTYVDFSFGLVPWTGNPVTVDVPSTGFGIVVASQFYTVMPAESPAVSPGYTLSIKQ